MAVWKRRYEVVNWEGHVEGDEGRRGKDWDSVRNIQIDIQIRQLYLNSSGFRFHLYLLPVNLDLHGCYTGTLQTPTLSLFHLSTMAARKKKKYFPSLAIFKWLKAPISYPRVTKIHTSFSPQFSQLHKRAPRDWRQLEFNFSYRLVNNNCLPSLSVVNDGQSALFSFFFWYLRHLNFTAFEPI